MVGFDVEAEAVTYDLWSYRIDIDNCAGPVAIAELNSLDYYTSWFLSVDSSPQVHVRAAELGPCLLADSNVVLEDCNIGRNENRHLGTAHERWSNRGRWR